MENVNTLEIRFLVKDKDFIFKPPVKIGLTLIDKNCYAISDFSNYKTLHDALTEWLILHDSSLQKRNMFKTIYNKFLIAKETMLEGYKDNKDFNINDSNTQESLQKENELYSQIQNNLSKYIEEFKDTEFGKNQSQEELEDTGCDKKQVQNEFLDIDFGKRQTQEDSYSLIDHKELSQTDFSEKEINHEQHLNDNHIVFGCNEGLFYKYSIDQRKITYEFGKVIKKWFLSITATPDKKNFLLVDNDGGLHEFNSLYQRVANFKVNEEIGKILATYDGKFLITTRKDMDNLTKWCMKTNKAIHNWGNTKSHLDKKRNYYIYSLTCTYHSKFLFIGYNRGLLSIFNLQNDTTVITIQALSQQICSVAVSRSKNFAYISDYSGNIRRFSMKNFDFHKDSISLGSHSTLSICLTKDQNNLLVGSFKKIKVFNIRSESIIKELDFSALVKKIGLFGDDNKALVITEQGEIASIDCEKFEITKEYLDYQNIAKGGKTISEVYIF